MMTLIRLLVPEFVVLTVVVVGFAAAASAQGVPVPDDVAAAPADAETTASGLAHKLLEAGTGAEHPGPRSSVVVHYTGWLANGTQFDSSVDRGQPIAFALDRVRIAEAVPVHVLVPGRRVEGVLLVDGLRSDLLFRRRGGLRFRYRADRYQA